jgi:hypothetical protein
MKRMLLALVCLCQSAAAFADWKYVRWGMTQQELIAASKGSARAIDKDDLRYGRSVAQTTATDGSWTFDVLFSGRLAFAGSPITSMRVDNMRFGVTTNCEGLLPYLRAKYTLVSETVGGDFRFADGGDEIRYYPVYSSCSFRRYKLGTYNRV